GERAAFLHRQVRVAALSPHIRGVRRLLPPVSDSGRDRSVLGRGTSLVPPALMSDPEMDALAGRTRPVASESLCPLPYDREPKRFFEDPVNRVFRKFDDSAILSRYCVSAVTADLHID